MSRKSMLLSITLGPGSFKRFAMFNAFSRQKRLKKPITICVAGFIGAMISFAMQDVSENMFLLGVLLCVIAFFVPGMYFRTFFASVKEQTTKMNIEKPRHVYTIELTSDANGIRFYHPDEKKAAGTFAWKEIIGAWRIDTAIYLYVDENRALLIPDTTKFTTQDDVWNFIRKHADDQKLHDERGKRRWF